MTGVRDPSDFNAFQNCEAKFYMNEMCIVRFFCENDNLEVPTISSFLSISGALSSQLLSSLILKKPCMAMWSEKRLHSSSSTIRPNVMKNVTKDIMLEIPSCEE